MGVASAFRNHLNMASGARVRLGRDGVVTVETLPGFGYRLDPCD